jgi:hypothetical protein
MIVVRIVGGLGNQMFQYAAGMALARRLGVELLLDLRAFQNYTLHNYGLNKFQICAALADPVRLKRWPQWSIRPYKLAQRLGLPVKCYNEPSMGYDSRWSSSNPGTLISGNFQSEKYFIDIATILRKEFTLRQPMSGANIELSQKMQSTESVMLHVRRGDYVNNLQTLSIHGVCSLDYYHRAISQIRSQVNQPHFFVFSNDLAWAKEHLHMSDDVTFVQGNDSSPEIDMLLMSKCRHHILANSTFSWWGSWLSENLNNVVVAPNQWFATDRYYTGDIIPSRWTKL